MRMLATGGAGYIGSVVVEELVAHAERVVVLDNLSKGHRGAGARPQSWCTGTSRTQRW
jgi:UDP-glucose 4-epimerase